MQAGYLSIIRHKNFKALAYSMCDNSCLNKICRAVVSSLTEIVSDQYFFVTRFCQLADNGKCNVHA